MKKAIVLSAAAGAALLSFNASATDILARVISSTPVVQQVAVPRQVCNNQQVVVEQPKSGAGALLGAVAGGAAGNAIGNGGGRALATMIGLVGGAMVGDRVEGSNNQVQNVQQCSTQTYYENRPSHYNVVYEYQGTQYNTQMANDPGQYVRLQVTPVGAINSAPQAGFQSQPQTYVQPAPAQPVYVQPQTYVQPTYIQPAYVQTAAYPVYYPAPAPYYRPYYPPIGVSLNLGYSRGYGGHRHWR
jgi:uncharacterized protein YcfJ